MVPRELQITQSALGLPIDIALGRCLQPQTKLVYANVFSGNILVYIVSLCHGPVQSIQPLVDWRDSTTSYNNVLATLSSGSFLNPNGTHFVVGGASIYVFDGTQTSLAPSGLATYDPAAEAEEVHNGIALAVVYQTFNATGFPSPATLRWIIEGYRLCEDPRDHVEKYTILPAIHARELLRNVTWGLQMPDDALHFDDSTDLGGWARAANDCVHSLFPAAPSTAPTAALGPPAGTAMVGDFGYAFTSLDANGLETLRSPVSTPLFVTFGHNVSVTVPPGETGTVNRELYRSETDMTNPDHLIATISGNASAVYVDANDPPLTGAAPPSIAPRTERYIMGLLISQQKNGQQWLDTILAHFAGKLSIDNGRYQCRVDQKMDVGYVPMVIQDHETTSAGIMTPSNVDPLSVEIWRKDDSELFNVATGTWLDANNFFIDDTMTIQRPGVTAGTERPSLATYDLPGCPDRNQMTRTLTLYENRSWDDLCFRVRGDRSLLRLQPGLDIAHCLIAGGDFLGRVLSVEMDDDAVLVEGEEYVEASYDETIQSLVTISGAGMSALSPFVSAGTGTVT